MTILSKVFYCTFAALLPESTRPWSDAGKFVSLKESFGIIYIRRSDQYYLLSDLENLFTFQKHNFKFLNTALCRYDLNALFMFDLN